MKYKFVFDKDKACHCCILTLQQKRYYEKHQAPEGENILDKIKVLASADDITIVTKHKYVITLTTVLLKEDAKVELCMNEETPKYMYISRNEQQEDEVSV